jgi:hypothetical protein
MVTNPAVLAAWEAQDQANDTLTFDQKRRLLGAMYQHARRFGHFDGRDMLEGIETTIGMATYMSADVRPASDRNRPRT